MSSVDPRVRDLFVHLRKAMDVIEELLLRPVPSPVQQSRPETQLPREAQVSHKLAYSIKEVRELIAISNSSLYKEIGDGRLRAVKRGNRTMILAADLKDWMSRWPASRSVRK